MSYSTKIFPTFTLPAAIWSDGIGNHQSDAEGVLGNATFAIARVAPNKTASTAQDRLAASTLAEWTTEALPSPRVSKMFSTNARRQSALVTKRVGPRLSLARLHDASTGATIVLDPGLPGTAPCRHRPSHPDAPCEDSRCQAT